MIIEYLEKYERGKLEDIIQYLIKRDFDIQEDIIELKNEIRKFLKSLKDANFSEITNDFYYIGKKSKELIETNEFYDYKCNITGTIFLKNIQLDLNLIKKSLINNTKSFGKIKVNTDETIPSLIGIFETELIQVSFSLNRNIDKFLPFDDIRSLNMNITSMMKGQIDSKSEFYNFIHNELPKRSIKRERTAFIPLKFGIYLILKIIVSELRKNDRVKIKLDFVNFSH